MDMRDRTELTFGEAMLHLNQCFNKRVFQMLNDAIRKEIENAKTGSNPSSSSARS